MASRPYRRSRRKSANPAKNAPPLGGKDTAARGAGDADREVRLPGPALHLLPFQRRWVEDSSPLKIVVKARQIGYSFAATLRAVLRCLEGKTTWIFLSKGERQSRLLMEKVQDHIRSCGVVARALESTFFEGTTIRQLETRFPNGSVIYGLPANPDTARGYTGNVTLDEFAFHADAEKIYSALFPTITRGYALEVISTPNGQQGKFYELAKAAGLVEPELGTGRWGLGNIGPSADRAIGPSEITRSPDHSITRSPESTQHLAPSAWSAHCCDIYEAVRQGLKIDLRLLRAGCDDETAWQQEYCCQFVSTSENFFPPELLAACLSAEASADTPPHLLASAPGIPEGLGTRDWGLGSIGPSGDRAIGPSQIARSSETPQHLAPSPEFYLGIDIGRHHDRTVFWLDEVTPLAASGGHPERSEGSTAPALQEQPQMLRSAQHDSLAIARLVESLDRAPFAQQLARARALLALTGADGQPLIRRAAIDATGMGAPLAESLAGEFGPRIEPVIFTAAVKEDLAYRTKRRMESRLSLLPDTGEIRRAFSAVKRYVTPSGNLRFDAVRTEAGHADEFWAKALADLAAVPSRGRQARLEDAFLVEGAPLISPGAFSEVGANWTAVDWGWELGTG